MTSTGRICRREVCVRANAGWGRKDTSMSVSDQIIKKGLLHAIEAIRESRAAADKAAATVHDDTTNVSVCPAHAAMVDLMVAQMFYSRTMSEGMETLLNSEVTTIEDRLERTNWTMVMVYINLALFGLSILIQVYMSAKGP